MSIETFAWVAGATLGVTYVLGGLIVNTYLARYRVTEYQILRAKYLAVGLVFLFNLMITLIPAAGIALGILALPGWMLPVTAIVSILAGGWMLVLWARKHIKRRFFRSWRLWVLLSITASAFPLAVGLRLAFGAPLDAFGGLLLIEGVVVGLLALTAQVYYYARLIYGQPHVFNGALDPTGMGAAVRVQLAGPPDDMQYLRDMGVLFINDRLTAEVLMVDETEEYHIIAFDGDDGRRAVKVDKDVIKAIIYYDYEEAEA